MNELPSCGICGRRHARDLSCVMAETSKNAHRCYLGDDCPLDGLTHEQIVEFTTLRHPVCFNCSRYAHDACDGDCVCRAKVCRERRGRGARSASDT